MNSDLALTIATSAHQGQVDKSGVDYIHHPMRVAAGFAQDSDESVVALLHDVLEDTDVTLDDLFAQGLTQAQADALVAITHLDNEPNVDYIARVKNNALATRVKLADLDDNSSPERMANLDQATQDRLQGKYDRARAQLLA
jgi:predicted transcriptional regulator of viral defense system